MEKWIPLCCLAKGDCATVRQIQISGAMRRRLQDLGLTEGVGIVCCHQALGLAAYWFCGTMVALRKSDAASILVQP